MIINNNNNRITIILMKTNKTNKINININNKTIMDSIKII